MYTLTVGIYFATFATSERGSELLIIDDFKFYKDSELKSGEMKWRCTLQMCNSKIYTAGNNDIVTSELIHNRDKEVNKSEREIVSTIAKRKATEDISSRPSNVIRTILRELPFHTYNSRRKMYPKIPSNRNEAHDVILSKRVVTNKAEEFVLHNDKDSGIVIFSYTNLYFY
ncbi:hypothetical protein ANN_22306 [Periplaneta americana]|uniref:FLYWCH-type domain-containing protein n=1 Tax=Periplaneta americana TaxID=6978 RepID=A0ABQ8S835_PERAM|nr:hypothetical protein ANN_22306 [Periplaneta americana]